MFPSSPLLTTVQVIEGPDRPVPSVAQTLDLNQRAEFTAAKDPTRRPHLTRHLDLRR